MPYRWPNPDIRNKCGQTQPKTQKKKIKSKKKKLNYAIRTI